MRYQVGGSLTADATSYISRRADTDFVASLKQGEFCYVLNSRQMGKSSLMVKAHQQFRQDGYQCAVLDMTNIGSENITPLQWYKGIIKDLWRSFKLSRQTNFAFKAWWQDEEDVSLLQRLSRFVRDVLLEQFPDEEMVIFVDEIDSILSLPFSVDDFFAWVRFCYNQRAIDPACKRIHFAIFGVATPSDLIRDRTRTPFNIGTPIYLDGFTQSEAQPLAEGITVQEGDSQAVLRAILDWTGGQPFLTQKLCQLAISSSQGAVTQPLKIPPGSESYWVERLVKKHIIDHWESQDEPEHLRTIRNRILSQSQTAGRLLSIYQNVLASTDGIGEAEPVRADDSRDQIELILSGLVTRSDGCLRLKNRVYGQIFDLTWVKQQLDQLRPYAQQFDAWISSKQTDESRLLRGQALKDAQLWAQGKRLSDADYRYLAASVESDRAAVQQAMESERQAAEKEKLQLQLDKEQETGKLQRRFLGAVSVALLAAVGFGGVTFWQFRQSQIGEISAIAQAAQGSFESHHQLEAFEEIILARNKLDSLLSPPADLALRVEQVLQRTLDGSSAINQINFETEPVSIDVHPDGELIAVVTTAGDLSFWTPEGQQVEHALADAITAQGDRPELVDVLFSPQGNQLIVSSRNSGIQLWTLSGELINTLDSEITSGTLQGVTPDGKTLLVKTSDTLTLLDLTSNAATELPKNHPIRKSALSADGQFIAATYAIRPPGYANRDGGAPGTSRNIRPAPSPETSESGGLPRRPPTLRHDEAGGAAQRERPPFPDNLQLWDGAGRPTAFFRTGNGPVSALAVNPLTNVIATAHVDSDIVLTQPDGAYIQSLFGTGVLVTALAYSPDGQILAAGDRNGGIQLWTVGGSRLKRLLGHAGGIRGFAFSPDGRWLASISEDSTVRFWRTGHSLHTSLSAHTDLVAGLAYSEDGRQLHSFSIDQSRNVWQRDESGHFAITPAAQSPFGMAPGNFSMSRDFGVITRKRRTGGVQITDFADTSLLDVPNDPQVVAVSAGPTSQHIAIAYQNGEIRTWERATDGPFPTDPQQTWQGADSRVTAMVWNEDESRLVVGTHDGTLTVWQGDEQVFSIAAAHRADIESIALSPDGNWIASASADKTVKLWRRDGSLVRTLQGHEAGVVTVAFSPDSQRLASGSVDGSVKLWQVGELPEDARPLLRSMKGHVGSVRYVTFSPDGQEVASAGSDRKVVVWKIDEILAVDELAYACEQVGAYLENQAEEEMRLLCQ